MSGIKLHKIFSYLRVAQKMKVAHLCLQRPETIVSKFSGARNVLQDSMKDIMETVAEVPLLMHIEASNSVYGFSYVYLEHSLCQRTYLTPVRNHRRPLRLLGGRFGDTFWRSNTCNGHRDLKFGIWLIQCISRKFLMSKNLFDTSQEPQTSS